MCLWLKKTRQRRFVKLGLRLFNLCAAMLAVLLILNIAATNSALLPALGPALNPLTGIWESGQNAQLPQSGSFHMSGLLRPVTVTFEQNGTPHIQAQTDADLFWMIGYLQAHFRLFQMDLMRRQGEGLLSQIFGPSTLTSDRFEDSLGLVSIAQAEWQTIPRASVTYQGLLAYTQGVNAYIQQAEQTRSLDAMFGLLGYQPLAWTPLDTLVIQNVMTQTLSFFNTPLEFSLLSHSLGYQRTMQWFPVLPPDTQHPFDTGPYTSATPAPLPAQQEALNSQAFQGIEAVAELLENLPANAVRHDSSSNSWAINGSKSATGQALLAGDPHLNLSLPAIWFQFEGSSPHYELNGVTVPGLPILLIGKTQHISWSITNGQTQSTLFYLEQTDRAHPDQYYWNGAWQKMEEVSYTIPVKGQGPVHFTVSKTVHGPIIPVESPAAGETVSVDWMGALPSNDLDAIFQLSQATNFDQFRNALREWVAPTLNFVYADDQGNIGLMAPGTYPVIRSGSPWLPLSGTGVSDVIGQIPFDDLPQVYDPPDHFIVTSNQRPVSDSYPYYIGTTLDFDNGYRADEIYTPLQQGTAFTLQDMERLQNSTQDYLASLIVPKLLSTLQQHSLSSQEQQAYTLLQSWDDTMQANGVAPTLWWTFWNAYLSDTFQPWWTTLKVPVSKSSWLAINADVTPLGEDLETWTLSDPTNAAFTLPNGKHRTASDVMFQAFQDALKTLARKPGGTLQQWQWGKLNLRTVPSLTYVDALGYGPVPSSGDDWTVNAADYYGTIHGPSWRMIVDWGGGVSEGVYPGGLSEDPLSPWYENQILPWLHGQYYPMLTSSQLTQSQKEAIWTIQP